jgi:signal transduction histidine kinase
MSATPTIAADPRTDLKLRSNLNPRQTPHAPPPPAPSAERNVPTTPQPPQKSDLPPAPVDPQSDPAYRSLIEDIRVRHARVGCILALVLVPAGVSLDWFVYPDLVWPIFKVRLLCDLCLVPWLLLLYTPFGKRYSRVMGSAWAMLPTWAMCWMIYASEGAMSPYYAGLNLVSVITCLTLPFTLWESIFYCGLLIASYALACVLHHVLTPTWHAGAQPLAWGTLFNNLYFLTLTAIVSVTGCHFSARRRQDDFRLRQELKIRNEQIDESFQKLSQLDRLKSEFFSNVSHELRTPLTLIISPIDDLLRKDSNIPEATRDCLETARRNALRLLKLISDLLEVVRLEEGRTELRREAVDLSVFVPAMVESVGQLARMKGLTLRNTGEPAPLVVQGDPARLEKIVLNILTNAIKFTTAGGSITSKWWRENGAAIVEITDTGVGIPEEALPRLFERFHQVDGSSTRKYQGMGIGLALARDLVEAHGGKLSARSQLGIGTTLRIELPITLEPTADAPSTHPKTDHADPIASIYHAANRTITITGNTPQSASPDTLGAGKHVVQVVDDEPDMRSFIVTTLAKSHRVIQSGDGLAGLAMAREKRPDLLVLDLMLPGMDGLDVCRELKSNEATRTIKIVLLTARMDEQSKLTALERGADDFLTKPFSSTELTTRITNLLQAADLEAQVRTRNQELETTLKRLKETEVQLVQSEKMNALGKLSAGLLHEINNPLNFTTMALDLAEQQASENESLLETLKDIAQGMSRIRTVVSDLRGFAHPPSLSDAEPFKLEAAVTTAMRMTSQELREIHVDTAALDGIEVVGDQNQVVHIIINLLVNSAHALRSVAADRKPAITISALRRGDRVDVLLKDNGTGVKPENLPRLCEPFFTTKEVGQGTGLGLSICHTIVKNHGGTLDITSQYGEWTQVRFDLAAAPAGAAIPAFSSQES